VVDVETIVDRAGSSNSLSGLKYETPVVGEGWWRRRLFVVSDPDWEAYELFTVVAVGEKAEGVVTLARGDGHVEWARVSVMREGWDFRPMTDYDRSAVPYTLMGCPEPQQLPLVA
jgi:hypothetical protein